MCLFNKYYTKIFKHISITLRNIQNAKIIFFDIYSDTVVLGKMAQYSKQF